MHERATGTPAAHRHQDGIEHKLAVDGRPGARERNEALDLEVYALTALYILGPAFVRSLKERAEQLAQLPVHSTAPALVGQDFWHWRNEHARRCLPLLSATFASRMTRVGRTVVTTHQRPSGAFQCGESTR
jgi:hypothetical protein